MKKGKFFINVTVVLLLIIVLTAVESSAYPGGIAGRTKKTTTTGCNSCHSYNTAITGIITGPDSVLAGQTVTFTLTINMATGSGKYGVDIAAKNGSLTAISGSGLTLMSGELVQSAGITYVNPKIIQFSYTAPTVSGSDTLYATIDIGHSGAWNWTPNKGFKVYTVTGITNNEIPSAYYLGQNFPNPFNPVTKISYGIMKASGVKITIFDLLGRVIAEPVNEFQNPGNYYVNFDASKFSSGIYYYKIDAGDFHETRKMSLIK